jgi:hypothetical protein
VSLYVVCEAEGKCAGLPLLQDDMESAAAFIRSQMEGVEHGGLHFDMSGLFDSR